MVQNAPHVVVIGAGYAGVMAANRILAGSPGSRSVRPRVTVINPRSEFVERIRLNQFAAGSGPAVRPMGTVLSQATEVVVGMVDRIDARSAAVRLLDGPVLRYDFLVYAVGSASGGGSVRGALEHCCMVADLEGAELMRSALAALSDGETVVIVGAGLTGIETAAEIAEQRPDLGVRLISSGDVAERLSRAARRSVCRRLGRLGVRLDVGVTVTEVTSDKVELSDGRLLVSDVTVWAGAFDVPDLAARSGLPVDGRGRLKVDATLSCVGFPNIVGVGDAAAPPVDVAGHLRMSCQAAMPMGAHGGDTVLAKIGGLEPRPLSLGLVMQCISLGRRAGVIQFTRGDDSPRWLVLRGRNGARLKERISRMTITWLSKAAAGGTYRWPKGHQ